MRAAIFLIGLVGFYLVLPLTWLLLHGEWILGEIIHSPEGILLLLMSAALSGMTMQVSPFLIKCLKGV